MSLVVLLILAVVWGVFLIPQVLRARADRGPADSIGAFRNQLSVLDRTAGSPGGSGVGVPSLSARRAAMHSAPTMGLGAPVAAYGVGYRRPSQTELQRRRQNVFMGLLGAVVVTLALGLVFRPFFALNLVVDLALVAYVALLARARSLAVEREMKVRYLRPGPSLAATAPMQQRRVSTGS